METKYSIRLSNGSVLEHCTLSGTTWHYPGALSSSVFEYNLSRVEIWPEEENPTTDIYTDMNLLFCIQQSEELTMFAMLPKTPQEIQAENMRADIDYIAMLTGITL